MPTILVLDDEEFVTALVKSALKMQKFEVVGINDPRFAVSSVANMDVDVFVTDLMMPFVNGFEVIEEIRANPELQDLPIIVLTAKKLTSDERKKLMELNTSVITKPFTPSALAERIQDVLK